MQSVKNMFVGKAKLLIRNVGHAFALILNYMLLLLLLKAFDLCMLPLTYAWSAEIVILHCK